MNFDAKVRRESTNTKDLFIAHIAAMDSFARGLRNASKIVEDGIMARHLKVFFAWTRKFQYRAIDKLFARRGYGIY